MNQAIELNQERNMTIPQIYYVMYMGRINNDAKVSLHIKDGVRYVCIHKRYFSSFENALNYLREDARNIVAPENREALVLEAA